MSVAPTRWGQWLLLAAKERPSGERRARNISTWMIVVMLLPALKEPNLSVPRPCAVMLIGKRSGLVYNAGSSRWFLPIMLPLTFMGRKIWGRTILRRFLMACGWWTIPSSSFMAFDPTRAYMYTILSH